MIDIHAHILPLVDDGSRSIERSVSLLKDCLEQGITDIILTPHHRQPYLESVEKTKESFEAFKVAVQKENLPINLYLGQEIFVTPDLKQKLRENKVLTMADSKYLLVEFDFSFGMDVAETVHELKTMGYIPIVAHLERYPYVSLFDAHEIKECGGLIQVNCESIAGKAKRQYFKTVKKLFKNNLVDLVASDYHDGRENCMKEAGKFVKKKFGEQVYNRVFIDNAKAIIKGQQ